MKLSTGATRPMTEQSARSDTGRTLQQWYAELDAAGGIAAGRSALGKFLQGLKVEPWWIATLTVEYERERGAVEKDGRIKGYGICSTKTLPVSPDRAFAAFTTQADLDRWFGASTTLDFRESGIFSNGDGNRGTFIRISPGKAIRFSWDDAEVGTGTSVEVLFQAKGDQTGLVINHSRIQTRADADALRAGWESALNALRVMLS